MKTKKPHEIIYITALITPTLEDGDVITLFALDDFSKLMFPTAMKKADSSNEEYMDLLVNFFNGINKTYDRKIHAQSTHYYTDLPEPFHPFMSACIMKQDKLIVDPKKVKQAFQPVLNEIMKRK